MSRTRRNFNGRSLRALGRPTQTAAILLSILLCVGGCETVARHYITNPPDITLCKETCDCIKHVACHDKCNPGCHRDGKGDNVNDSTL